MWKSSLLFVLGCVAACEAAPDPTLRIGKPHRGRDASAAIDESPEVVLSPDQSSSSGVLPDEKRCYVDANGKVSKTNVGAGAVLEGVVRASIDKASCIVCRNGAWATDLASPNVAGQCTNALEPLHDHPVLSIAFTPDADGDGRVDRDATDVDDSVENLEHRIRTMEVDITGLLTEASRYKGFRDPDARPSLGYRVVEAKFRRDAVPRGLPLEPGQARPDYMAILRAADVCTWVDQRNVREIWMWTQHHGGIVPVESNLSSDFGDVSNSERTDDLPHCAHAYALYNYNFTRGPAEALHDHGHHFEALLREWDPEHVFWTRFVGSVEGSSNLSGVVRRCGWTHYPPNATTDYDYRNPALVGSDCEDWRPDSFGASKPTGCGALATYRYGSPECRDDGGLAFYVWWMQNLPGAGNTITFRGRPMRNWWDYLSELDAVVANGGAPYTR